MNGSNKTTHSSKDFCFEVPVVNVEDVKSFNHTEDPDCTYIEHKNSQGSRLSNANMESTKVLQNNTKDATIVIDEDEIDNDCTITEDQIISENMLENSFENSNKHSTTSKKQNIDNVSVNGEETQENDCCIVATYISSQDQSSSHKPLKNSKKPNDQIYRQNKVLIKVIDKCLELENTTGMTRVINKALLPVYHDTSEAFKKSAGLERILMKTLERLEMEPDRKFSFLRELIDTMKMGLFSAKTGPQNAQKIKRAQLTTLKTNLNGKFTNSVTGASDSNITKQDIIDLEDDDDDDDDIVMVNTGIQINDVRSQAVGAPSIQISNVCKNHVENKNDFNVAINEHGSIKDGKTNEHGETDDNFILVEDKNPNANKKKLTVTCKKSIDKTIGTATRINCNIRKRRNTDDINQVTNSRALSQPSQPVTNLPENEINNVPINECSKINDETNEHREMDDDVILIEDDKNNDYQNNLVVTCEKSKQTAVCTAPRVIGNIRKRRKTYDCIREYDSYYDKEKNMPQPSMAVTNLQENDMNNVAINDFRKINDERNGHSKTVESAIVVEDINHNTNTKNEIFTAPYITCSAKRYGYTYNSELDFDMSKDDINTIDKCLSPRDLLEPLRTVTISPKVDIKIKIEEIENQIKCFNELIEELDLKEVEWTDDHNSSFIQSEKYKEKVVLLYEELCKLTRTDSVKRPKVRLKVIEGRHKGPMQCLEKFLNDNIGKDGRIPFPDIHDVIKCVCKANVMYQLGWSKGQIKSEAHALFIHYGRRAQARRRMRDWQHILRFVKEEIVDPADEDPTLQARLEHNAKVAVKKENDLFDMYVLMEYTNEKCIASRCLTSEESEYDAETSAVYNKTVSNDSDVGVTSNETLSSKIVNSTEITKDQVIDNVVINDAHNVTIQRITGPLEVVSYPLKYGVVDDTMQPIGYIVTPQPNCAEPSNTELLINNMTGNPNANEPNSLNTVVDNAVQQNDKENEAPVFNAHNCIKHDLAETGFHENNGVNDRAKDVTNSLNRHNSEISNGENSRAQFDTDGKPFCTPNKLIQYNEVSTNSCADTINFVTNEIRPLNSEVSSSTKERTKNCGHVNVTESVKIRDITCALVNNATETVYKTCGLVNATGSSTGDESCEHASVIQSKDNESKSCEPIKDAGSTDARENLKKGNDAVLADARKNRGIGNDAGSIDARDNCEIGNDAGSSNTDSNFIVKKEKLDIPLMLESLGSDYTVTIIDIEDPFEVIEISDSSDSENDVSESEYDL